MSIPYAVASACNSAGISVLNAFAWHTLYCPKLARFQAQGYVNAQYLNAGEPIPDEVNTGGGANDLESVSGLSTTGYLEADSRLNGQPSISNNTSGSTEHSSGTFSGSDDVDLDYSVVMIFHPSSVTAAQYMLCDTNNDSRYLLGMDQNGNMEYTYGGGAVKTGTGTPISSGTTYGLVHHVTSAASSVYLGGSLDTTVATGGRAVEGWELFGDDAGSNVFKGAIGFMGAFEGDIRTHGSWPAFQTWVLDNYAVAI